jgi:hypothetical protein
MVSAVYLSRQGTGVQPLADDGLPEVSSADLHIRTVLNTSTAKTSVCRKVCSSVGAIPVVTGSCRDARLRIRRRLHHFDELLPQVEISDERHPFAVTVFGLFEAT